VIKAANVVTPTIDLVGDIGRSVLGHLLPDRRPRVSTRKVKSPLSRYAARKNDGRPTTTQKIISLVATIHWHPDPPAPSELTHDPEP
jgi:hypothetical protein